MIAPPAFGSLHEYAAHLGDVDLWAPYLAVILRRLGLPEAAPVAGENPTWPTFVCGDVVVKLFGAHATWRRTLEAERGALALVATDQGILAPRLLGEGALADDGTWPFLVTTRVPGSAWDGSSPGARSIAEDLGRQVRRVHALDPSGVASDADHGDLDVTAAATRSSLPPHLVAQAGGFVARLGPFDRAVVHADLVAQHVFVSEGRVTGIIDWADALVTDRHVELIQVFRDIFACDRELFGVFLDASGWPIAADFPHRTLGHALRRQALMLAQHPQGGDVFEPIAARFPLEEIATLDELAEVLFGQR